MNYFPWIAGGAALGFAARGRRAVYAHGWEWRDLMGDDFSTLDGEFREDGEKVGWMRVIPVSAVAIKCLPFYRKLEDAHGHAPIYEVNNVAIDWRLQGKGHGTRFYLAAIQKLRDSHPGGFYLVSSSCGKGTTKPQALRVFDSLRKRFPGAGTGWYQALYIPPGKASRSRSQRHGLGSDEARIAAGILHLQGRPPVAVRRFGRGMFTQAWLGDDGKVYLDVDEQAREKEILTAIRRETRSKHLPNVESVGWTRKGRMYRMPRYTLLTQTQSNTGSTAWRQHDVLKQCLDAAYAGYFQSQGSEGAASYRAYSVFRVIPPSASRRLHKINGQVVECARKAKLPRPLVRALGLLADGARAQGSSYAFEFNPGNLAVDSSGNLILLDVLLDTNLVKEKA